MILVVYHHVVNKCFNNMTIIDSALKSFRMPAFFFVSGFIAYKALEFWTTKNTANRLLKKFRVQVIPTLIFYCVYFYFIRDCQPILLLSEYGWRQYWFTIVLFEFFTVYFITNYFTKNSQRINTLLLVSLSVFCMYAHHHLLGKEKISLWLDLFDFTYFLPYFIAGSFTRKYFNHIIGVLDKNAFQIIIASLFVLQLVAINYIKMAQPIVNFIVIWSLRVNGLIMVFGLFVRFRDYFTPSNKLSQGLSFIGRRTLDIYLLHFFFITHIPQLHRYVLSPYLGIFERPVLIIITAVVVAACLLTSGVIRRNKFLGKLLFAAN